MVQDTAQLYLQWRTNSKSYMIYQTAPFSTTLNDPNPRFQGNAILNITETVRDTDIVSMQLLTGTYISLYSRVSFRMTLSDIIFNDMKHCAASLP